ncbi:MAG: helix-turn-helix domain-containing protein [Candidatus Gottesmanbacteria bacterium]|nr:helix-turn-helix domain-containing protein [Candidatus Gottesmanbacteria bacterium]
MARVIDRRKAIFFRKQGMTYGEIKKRLRVSKSTLSEWLRDEPLTNDQMVSLAVNKKKSRELAVEKTRIVKLNKRQARLSQIYSQEKKRLVPIDLKSLEIAGLFLYWGEGNKRTPTSIALNNTDPMVVKFYLYWLLKILKVPKERIHVSLHLYSDMDREKEMLYWSTTLKLSLTQFQKPYVKKSLRMMVDHKGYGHGTCGLIFNNARLKERVLLGIKAIAEYYATRI